MWSLRKGLKYLVIAGGALTLAACQSLADLPSGYRFEQVQAITDHSVSVRLVRADGAAVANAQLYARHWMFSTGPKSPPPREQLTELGPDGHGGFVVTSDDLHPGETLFLAARLTPDGDLERGSIDLH
jgi:hypothetical protein